MTVGIGAKIIHVGGCVVEFQAKSFSEPQEITVTAEINPRNWPPDKEAITPSLSIRAKNLLKEATVKLHTWSCNGEDEEDNVEIWRHTKKENKWDIVETCSIGESNFIEFKVSHFCSFVATLKNYFKSRYIIRPMVYYSAWDFAVALIKDTPLVREHLHKEMETTIGAGMRQKILSPLKCKKSDEVKTVICSMPEEGFKFEPGDKFLHPIQEVYGKAKKSYHCVTLTSQLPARSITVAIKFLQDDKELRAPDGFRHQWKPGECEPVLSCFLPRELGDFWRSCIQPIHKIENTPLPTNLGSLTHFPSRQELHDSTRLFTSCFVCRRHLTFKRGAQTIRGRGIASKEIHSTTNNLCGI